MAEISRTVIKSQYDQRVYKSIELANKMKVILVHDATADKSGAALAVNIGQFSDPAGIDGLAHFLEHMLFLGTEKFPNQNDYDSFLSQNAGYSNAYTSHDHTNYYFVVANSGLEEALDRTSQFFLHPLFTGDLVDREMNAVHSEHQKNLTNDRRRVYQLFRSTSHKGTPFSRFSTGCLETLQVPNIRDRVIEFYSSNYSANLMNLCIYGSDPIDKLEEWAHKYFSGVKNNSTQVPIFKDLPFDEKNLAAFYKLVPIQDKDRLNIVWVVENMRPNYKNNPLAMLSHLIGHEGPGSLLSLLIDEGLATALSCSDEDEMNLFSTLNVSITLTKRGLSRYEDVIEFVYSYLRILKDQPIPQYLHDEEKQVRKSKFLFKDKGSAEDEAANIVSRMCLYPTEEVLIAPYFLEEFKPELIQKLAQSLTVKNMRIDFESLAWKGKTDQIEHYYNIEYSVTPISENIRQRCDNPQITPTRSKKQLHLPPPNTFIPSNFEILPGPLSARPKYPAKIFENDATIIWHKLDHQFEVPKATACLEIIIGAIHPDPHVDHLFKRVWREDFEKFLKETAYMAQLASISIDITLEPSGYAIEVNGFNASFANLFTALAAKLIEYTPLGATFNDTVEKVMLDLENHQKHSPYLLVGRRSAALRKVRSEFLPEQVLRVRDQLSFEAFLGYSRKLFAKVRLEWLVGGNISSEEVKQIAWSFERNLAKLSKDHRILAKNEVEEHRMVKIPTQSHLFYEFNLPLESETNSAIITHYELGPISKRIDDQVLALLLENYLEEKAYNQLRTTEQLGYIVSSRRDLTGSVCTFRILIQSEAKPSHYLAERIQAFLSETIPKMKDVLTAEDFQKYAQSVQVSVSQKFLSISEEIDFFAREVRTHQYQFDRRELQLQRLQSITREQLLQFSERVYLQQRQILEIHAVAPSHFNENEKLKRERLGSNPTLKFISSIESFQKNNMLYPEFQALI